MIIDTHQHFWKYDPARDAWIDDSMKRLQKDFLPKDLKPILDINGVEGCVTVQAHQSENENDFLLECARQSPFVKGVVGWVDLCAENCKERLEYFSRNKVFKGVRHIVQAEKEGFMMQKKFQNGISQLAQYGLVYDILIHPKQIKEAIRLVREFPDQGFVIDHLAKPLIRTQEIDTWKNDITALATLPNVYCKLSGMVTEADMKSWNTTDFEPYMKVVLSAFGPERILYGSDWPVCLLAAEYEEVLEIVRTYIEELSEDEQKAIFSGNAIKLYNLHV
ncbi:amidohydrolase [Maribacter sp. 4U21]|uniref:amidohydrolase family protein n=1 Tax=Maribacter sp. 4U21 TaxID=1889779 RepID=UPI000C153AF0|nr:amidohydrolase family protein [Maribacter sp. 4U21]PIB29512.1 amidohydrolase [Maribacter sp. 4U21]